MEKKCCLIKKNIHNTYTHFFSDGEEKTAGTVKSGDKARFLFFYIKKKNVPLHTRVVPDIRPFLIYGIRVEELFKIKKGLPNKSYQYITEIYNTLQFCIISWTGYIIYVYIYYITL